MAARHARRQEWEEDNEDDPGPELAPSEGLGANPPYPPARAPLPDVPGRRKVYLIHTFHWEYYDHGDYGWDASQGTSLLAFTDREKAEEYLAEVRRACTRRDFGIIETYLDD